ncbi:MAG: S8 family serine peptidase [Clostridia bacterium]|nr:S8 family serine peptidase [Clostridia bacterium]
MAITSNVAYALNPNSYLDALNNFGYEGTAPEDWWMGSNYLNMFAVKSVFNQQIKAELDLDYLEEHPVVIAVIDTGIQYDLDMFTGLYDENGDQLTSITDPEYISPYDVFYRDSDGNIIGKNAASNKNGDPQDDIMDKSPEGHGTHVSGILATLIHYMDLEKYIKIMPIRSSFIKDGANAFNKDNVLGTNGAYRFAVSNGADIINMSLTADADWNSNLFETYKSSVITVAAAGNNGKNSSVTKYYPAGNSNVVGVMNYTHNGDYTDIQKYSSSNYGDIYDIFAPGGEIVSTVSESATGVKFEQDGQMYGKLSGTSMATPIVSFAAALLTLKYRGLQGENGTEIPANAIKEFLLKEQKTIEIGDVKYKVLDLEKTITEDFLDETDEEVIITPTSISISAKTSDLTQTLDEVHAITLTADLEPVNYENAPYIYWVEYDNDGNETVVGRGKTIQYAPHREVGSTRVEARMDYKNPGSGPKYLYSPTITIEVSYYRLTSTKAIIVSNDSITTAENQTIKSGEAVNFSVAKYEYCNKDQVTIEWYVNGELKSTDPYYEFKETNPGEYEIVVAVNTIKSANSTKIVVEPSNEGKTVKMEMWKIWLISTAITVVIAAVVIILFVKRKK